MSLVPMLFSNWWEELDRPHRLWDQHFGLTVDPEELLGDLDRTTDIMLYRPRRRGHRRYHPFNAAAVRRGRGASVVQPDKNKFQVTLDVAHFAPDEITVKVVDRDVVVEARHEEKEDEHGWISRQFVRKYMVPSQCDIERVESQLSSDGILTISVPRKEPSKPETNERQIKIQFTGKPAVTDYEANADTSSSSEAQRNQQQNQQRGQQQQQQQQQQQGPRGRKGIVKAA